MSQPDRQRNENKQHPGLLLLAIVVWTTVGVLSVVSYAPPKPRPGSIAADQFSAFRADKILEELIGDSIPHPAGSVQNEVVRNKIVAMLDSYGYSTEVQSGTGTVAPQVRDRSPDRNQVDIHNIIAIRRAHPNQRSSGNLPIMLVSHYDSVPFGPGASDDGVATAALMEIARMLSREPAPDRDIVFLFTDGEELGLLGAKLFTGEHPLARRIGIAINLEARGTTGPSCMFETSRNSRILIPIFARANDRKFASSLFLEIYKRLPRDTDFSIFKRAGIPGFNFAFIGNVNSYHTTADNYVNVDQGSLQHHGDNALGLLRELLATPGADTLVETGSTTNHEVVYFDLFGKWIIWWPSGWSIWLSSIALLMLIGSVAFMTRSQLRIPGNETASFRADLGRHLGIQFLSIVCVFGIGYLIQSAVRLEPRLGHPWPAQPIPIWLGYWLSSFAVVGGITMAFQRQLLDRYCLISFCVFWLILAFMTSMFLTGASHLFVVPVLVTCAFGLVASWMDHRRFPLTLFVSAVAVGMIWIPLERVFYDAVGFRMPWIMMARIAIVSTTILGLLSVTNERTKFCFTMLTATSSIIAFVVAIVLAR